MAKQIKRTRSVILSQEVDDAITKEIETQRFRNWSHALEYLVTQVLKQEGKLK